MEPFNQGPTLTLYTSRDTCIYMPPAIAKRPDNRCFSRAKAVCVCPGPCRSADVGFVFCASRNFRRVVGVCLQDGLFIAGESEFTFSACRFWAVFFFLGGSKSWVGFRLDVNELILLSKQSLGNEDIFNFLRIFDNAWQFLCQIFTQQI